MKPGMEGVQETASKIAVERKLQDEVSQLIVGLSRRQNLLYPNPNQCTWCFPPIPYFQGEQVYNTLKQQEEMRISGKSARQMVMQVRS